MSSTVVTLGNSGKNIGHPILFQHIVLRLLAGAMVDFYAWAYALRRRRSAQRADRRQSRGFERVDSCRNDRVGSCAVEKVDADSDGLGK